MNNLDPIAEADKIAQLVASEAQRTDDPLAFTHRFYADLKSDWACLAEIKTKLILIAEKRKL